MGRESLLRIVKERREAVSSKDKHRRFFRSHPPPLDTDSSESITTCRYNIYSNRSSPIRRRPRKKPALTHHEFHLWPSSDIKIFLGERRSTLPNVFDDEMMKQTSRCCLCCKHTNHLLSTVLLAQ
jgi:hypothetical protein